MFTHIENWRHLQFFRYISERYPLTSQLIEENKIPEFDNLYVDFNGIIHNCSHPNDGDAHFRLSEDQIFTAIFSYVDHLFGKIKPKKLFFMAIDGVAPRAKMNQQRSRRFRTAKEAKEVRERAEKKGERLPTEKAFDSNCITPGTVFMKKLSAQLKYFVNKKISEDANWRDVQVVLSGHEVPGEGEHKIMEYIRLSKAQPDYDPNVRHCLYGLDADLIMLGLLSHDPHFCLLREEVKFGPQKNKGNRSLESQNFFLLHISLLREYLNHEFSSLASTLPFPYDLERIIDDFVLIAVFIGNDFLPHLPDLHIHQNALERLFEIYKVVLPRAGGYLNEGGEINRGRLQLVLDELSTYEQEVFERESSDQGWYKSKQRKHQQPALDQDKKELKLTPSQRNIVIKVREMVQNSEHDSNARELKLVNDLSAGDRSFITQLAKDLHLDIWWDEFDEQDRNLVTVALPELSDDDEAAEEEGRRATQRVLKKYLGAPVLSTEGFDEREDERIQGEIRKWKNAYYSEKLEFKASNTEALDKLVYRYVEGLQWVMYYYYSGVVSWAWFYDYHYAPRISDLKNVESFQFNFELGKPFKPFEQLMGVLPYASHELIPEAYRELMYSDHSPIKDFYPETFELDMNGKRQEWEAIVKIPFIQQDRLLTSMATVEHRLTDEERHRNTWGMSIKFTYTKEIKEYPSPSPGFLPVIARCHCRMDEFVLPTLDGLHLVKGLCDGVFLGTDALAGFPSLQTLPHSTITTHHSVNVFNSDSRNQSIVIRIEDNFTGVKASAIAEQMTGKRTFIGWPFLTEALVVAVSDDLFKHERQNFGGTSKIVANPHHGDQLSKWRRSAEKISTTYSKRFAVEIGDVEILLHVRPLKGLKRKEDGSFIKDYAGPEAETEQPVQLSLMSVLRMSGLALSKITSSFMVTTGNQKTNLGLSLKFEAKSMKVLGYSRKSDQGWEFSEKAVELIQEYKAAFPSIFAVLDSRRDDITRASDLFPNDDPEAKVKQAKEWLASKGVRDFEPVSLFSDQLEKQNVANIEKYMEELKENRGELKRVMVQGVPRQALLKPDHAVYRLQNQKFTLGDRVVMVQNTGGVPLAAKGVVIGLAPTLLDVIWDVPFINGTTLQGRCSEYRGSSIPFDTVLNLTNPQFVQSTSNKARIAPEQPTTRFVPRTGPHPVVQPRGGAAPQGGFRPSSQGPVRIMSNPARGRGWGAQRVDDRSAARVLADPVPDADDLHWRGIRESFNIRGAPQRGRGGPPQASHHPAPSHPPRILQAPARPRQTPGQYNQPTAPAASAAHPPTTNGHADRGTPRGAGRGGPRGSTRGRGRGFAPSVQS
ncbi:hypothetical protein FRC08_002716 [Ceratobasidium sp. 394]|nr:hypothetical protein FRC08_002716 [Ceratobasidium sp. 394]